MKNVRQKPHGSPYLAALRKVAPPSGGQAHVPTFLPQSSRHRVARSSAIAAAVLFGLLAGFQVALALGLPWGEAAWGGAHAELGVGLRVASGVQAVLATGFSLIVLRRAGHQIWAPLPSRWLPIATRILAGYMALGTLMNAASRSSLERAMWTPVAISLAILCGIVAVWSPRLSALQPGDTDQ